MRSRLKTTLVGAVLLAALASVSPLTSATPAAAATSNGTVTLNPTSGTSGTNFTIGLGVNPSCPGDSATGNYRVQSFMIPAAADIDSTLRFNSSGPVPVGSEFRQPLFDTTSSPYVNKLTDIAVSPAVTGGISGLPQFNWGSVFGPGDVPAGQYNVGIACTVGAAGPTQLRTYWTRFVTVTATGVGLGGPAQFDWAQGTNAQAPVLASPLVVGDGSLTASFTQPGTPSPAVSGYLAVATPAGGGTAVTATGATSPITIPGLTAGTAYDVTVHATNGSPESNVVSGTPGDQPQAPVLTSPLTVGDGSLTATFTPPATAIPAVTGYTATATPTGGGTAVTATGATSPIAIPGLTNGTSYDVTVHATNTLGDSPESNVVAGTPVAPAVYKVDGEIRRSTVATYVGNNVYNTTGANQTRTASIRRGRVGQFIVRIRNEANVTDSLKVKGTAGSGQFTVRYFNGAANVTAQVVAGTFRFNNVPANGTRTLTVKITVGARATVGSAKSVVVTATSVGNATKKDAVKATVTAAR